MWLQILTAGLGAFGFSLLFNVRGKKLIIIFVGGTAAWGIYLVNQALGGSTFFGLLLASVFVSTISEILARVAKTPISMFLVPMLIPLIPGSALFYSAVELVENNTSAVASSSRIAMTSALAIAFGIIIVTCTVQVITKITSFVKRKRNR